MNKEQYKRYTHTKEDLKKVNDEIEKTFNRITLLGFERETKEVRAETSKLEKLLLKKSLISATLDELILPKNVCYKNGYNEVVKWCEENPTFKTEEILNAMVEEYLEDNYNKTPTEFAWSVNNGSIYFSRIRWHKNQILKEDIKDLKKGKIHDIETNEVLVFKHPQFKNLIMVKNKKTDYIAKCCSINEVVKYLEDHYLM